MKVNIISRKLIKPHTATPKSLNTYKLSFKDELSPPMNVSLVFFYPSNPKQTHFDLQESLAKVLPQFYPLAGRYIRKEGTVDCSDQGAEFVEAEITGINLTDLITAEITTEQLKHLLPRQCDEIDGATDPLLSIQIAEFKSCGGLAISVSISHRIFDGYSIGTFIAAWSNCNSNPGGRVTIMPNFNSASLFPGKNLNYCSDPMPFDPTISVKRFVFTKEAITSLRSKLKPRDGENKVVSRVRVVSAVIAKALMGMERAKRLKPRPSLIAQAVDIRDRTIPPLPKYSCGNLVIQSLLQIETEDDLGIQEMVDLMGGAIEKTVSKCAGILESANHNSIISIETHINETVESEEMNVMWFSDWSKFGFDEVDFGWGKPVWATVGAFPAKNLIVLMNNREGDHGIEAWVHLDHHDMPYFHQDHDIKFFTT